ncbi:hypothetical protein BsWGS_25005 [Bradybaena similaris]
MFAMSTLALLVCLVCIKIVEQKEQSLEETILQKYPGHFRTPEEQAIFEEQHNRLAAINDSSPVTSGTTQDNCTFPCPFYRNKRSPSQASARQVRDSGEVYHGCCISKPYLKKLDIAEDAYGNTVTVAKLKNISQYFPTETCETAAGCTDCLCAQGTALTAAVVLGSDGQYIFKLIKVPGCCKCYNVGR